MRETLDEEVATRTCIAGCGRVSILGLLLSGLEVTGFEPVATTLRTYPTHPALRLQSSEDASSRDAAVTSSCSMSTRASAHFQAMSNVCARITSTPSSCSLMVAGQ